VVTRQVVASFNSAGKSPSSNWPHWATSAALSQPCPCILER
jgi:hypothetical protein